LGELDSQVAEQANLALTQATKRHCRALPATDCDQVQHPERQRGIVEEVDMRQRPILDSSIQAPS
jgi:hypothetical protein